MSDRTQANQAEVPWLLEAPQKSKLARPERRQQRPQSAKPPLASTDDAQQPRPKRRKHDGIRFDTPPQEEQPQPTGQDSYHMPVAQGRPAANHNLIERAKAESQLVGRRFQLDNSCCNVPSKHQLFESQPWTLPELMIEKNKLNAVKDMLDCKDIKPWGAHTAFTNRAGLVVRQIRQHHGEVELCTTAWAKVYESIVTFDLLPAPSGQHSESNSVVGHLDNGQPAVGTVHLCEAPGGFISATNHFIRTHRPDWHWEWIGSSLHPYYEGNDPVAMIDDDALIQATLPHWHWGEDGSGDIRRPDNISAICASAGNMARDLHCGGAMLVTADGSVDCQENPNEQEMSTASLHFCEMVTALGLLAPGGSFILKAFTLFEHPTVCALYLMGALFKEVHVYKPATSKPGNSEIYIIGKNFKGVDAELHSFLVSCVAEEVFQGRAMLPLKGISDSFLKSCIDCAAYFAGVQQQVISDNLATDQFMPAAQRSALNAAKHWMAQEWPRRFNLKPVGRAQFLAPHVSLSGSNNNTSNPVHRREKHDGTLAERVALGKRRREQLGMQTAADRQEAPAQPGLLPAAGQSNSMSGADATTSPAAAGAVGSNGPMGALSGAAGNMMSSWGYTPGMGLGKDLQGMAQKLDVNPNRGRAGLGLAQSSLQTPSAPSSLSPQPDSAILTNDHAVLSFDEMEWWRIMEQKEPAKLLRSKFLPQDDILVALRSARNLQQDWVERQHCSAGAQPHRRTDTGSVNAPEQNDTQSADASNRVRSETMQHATQEVSATPSSPGAITQGPAACAAGEREALSSGPEAVESSPGSFCLHQGLCNRPQDSTHSQGFWHMAALDSAFSICSSLAAAQQAQHAGSSKAALNSVLDLSPHNTGALKFVMTKAGARFELVQVLSDEAAQKLQTHSSNAAFKVHSLGHDTNSNLKLDTAAVMPVEASTGEAAAEHTQTDSALPCPPSTADSTLQQSRLNTAAIQQTDVQAETPPLYSLASFEGLSKGLHGAKLVIGNLDPDRELPRQNSSSAEGQQPVDTADRKVSAAERQAVPVDGEAKGRPGVMEAEYGKEYRARLLWECAMALSCLEPGGSFVMQLPDSLTTFTVSMLYLLMRSFSGLSLVKPFTSCACSGARFLVCMGRLDDGNVGALWLKEVMKHSEELSSSGKIVGEFVPPSSYISCQLLEYLSHRNAALAQFEIKALHHVKTQHDSGKMPSAAQQAKTLEQAKQQLQLTQPSSSPYIITPAQQPSGLLSTGLKPGLGFAPDLDSSVADAVPSTRASDPHAASNKASAESSSQHQAARQAQHSAEQQQTGRLQKNQDFCGMKQFCGPLYVRGHKGEELICELETDSWPAHLARPKKMIVCSYLSAGEAMAIPKLAHLGQLCVSQPDQAKSLQGFQQYLTGFRGAGRQLSEPKVAVIETSTYTLLLKEVAEVNKTLTAAAVDCWVCTRS